MNTKKLLLGFCVLAAVTGGAPHVFGEKDGCAPSTDASSQVIAENTVHVRRLRRAANLDAKMKKLKSQTDVLEASGKKEQRCVGAAYWCELRAHFLRGVGPHRYNSACEIADKIRSELDDLKQRIVVIEDMRVHGHLSRFDAFWAKRKANAKIKRLTEKLREAIVHIDLVSSLNIFNEHVADNYIETARRLFEQAAELRAARIERLAEMNDDDIREHQTGQSDDINSGLSSLDIVEIDAINAAKAEEDRAFVRESNRRHDLEGALISGISDLCTYHKESWLLYAIDGYEECDDLKTSYQPRQLYVLSMEPFNEQKARVDAAFGRHQ
jgi:hypothetical protein